MLKLLQNCKTIRELKQTHLQILMHGLHESDFVLPKLITLASELVSLDYAVRIFRNSQYPNVISYNTMIKCFVGKTHQGALRVYDQMKALAILPNSFTFTFLLRLGDIKSAQCIFDQMPKRTVVSWTAMISGYTMIGDLESARNVFDQMPFKNVVSWNAMIAGYVHNHEFDRALYVFHQMLKDGKCRPDQTTLLSVLSACSHMGSLEHGKWIDSYTKRNNFDLSIPLGNALIDMFAKCGDIENAKAVFDKMAKTCVITWTTMILGLAVNGHCKDALALFDRMHVEGIKPDDVIFIAVLSACTHGGLVEEGERVFDQMVHKFGIVPRIEHYGCMVDLLGRAGKLEKAVQFIKGMHLDPNAVIWATLLGSCKIHGNGDMLESVTRKIMELEPSNPNYLTLISNLSASIGQWRAALISRVAMRQQGMEKVPGCSSIQVGDKVHEFLARDTSHEERKEIYWALSCLNGHLKAVCYGS
ncbi:putative pentatricopeptide repeat-containing protein [Quercus suber]|uniref:Pentatricopeptide repeat-containing protein n=1 Tax=Quercus suber TaxID=58331 RepID=A0AAW0LYK2_QUESU